MSRLAVRRAPTMPELVVMLSGMPDGPDRARVEEWYWCLAIEKHGLRRAGWYRAEYEWLRAHRDCLSGETIAREVAA